MAFGVLKTEAWRFLGFEGRDGGWGWSEVVAPLGRVWGLGMEVLGMLVCVFVYYRDFWWILVGLGMLGS